MPVRTSAAARENLLAVAGRLFYEEGVRSVGIERLLHESGTAKATLYHHFKSKDELVAAWIEQSAQAWRSWFVERVECLAPSSEGKIAAVFDALFERFSAEGFRGCAFNNTINELRGQDHPACVVARDHKLAIEAQLRSWLDQSRPHDAPGNAELAMQLSMLIDGAISRAVRTGDPAAALSARRAALTLVREQDTNS